MLKHLLQVLCPALGVALLLLAVALVGQATQDVAPRGRHAAIAFGDIACQPPFGVEQAEFLDEVQYLGSLPDRLSVADEGLCERLAAAFARHPWVERVEQVEVVRPAGLRVRLVYRRPVLAVCLKDQLRAVDGQGVLLPVTAVAEGLPLYAGSAPPPRGLAGTAWGDPAVEAAAREAANKGTGPNTLD